jgi:hypothetical protein
MKLRLSRLAILAIIFVNILTFASTPTPAYARCLVGSATYPIGVSVNTLAGHRYTIVSNIFPPLTTAPSPTGSTYFTVFVGETISIFDEDSNCGEGKEPALFNDGRQNKNDAGQTAAVYCGVPNSGDVRVYALFNGVGSIDFTVTKAQLAAGVQKPARPYLIKSAKGAELWRLQDGSLRIKRGTYVFDWPGC